MPAALERHIADLVRASGQPEAAVRRVILAQVGLAAASLGLTRKAATPYGELRERGGQLGLAPTARLARLLRGEVAAEDLGREIGARA